MLNMRDAALIRGAAEDEVSDGRMRADKVQALRRRRHIANGGANKLSAAWIFSTATKGKTPI